MTQCVTGDLDVEQLAIISRPKRAPSRWESNHRLGTHFGLETLCDGSKIRSPHTRWIFQEPRFNQIWPALSGSYRSASQAR